MEFDKANITTYITGIILAITTYLGVSEATSGVLVQLLAPILAIIVSIIVSYFNEKYPSNLITQVVTENDVDNFEELTDNVDGI